MSPPRVCVIIPCFNDGATLAEAVASVKTAFPVEVIVVDDGSTDAATAVVLDALPTGTVRIHQANAGPGVARNTALAFTRAEFVFGLDADDRLLPGALDALVEALDAEPGADAAWGDIVLCGSRSGLVRKGRVLDPWRILYLDDLPGAGTLFRRAALEAVGGWGAGDCEDWDLWMALAGRGARGVHVGRPVYAYRVGEGRRDGAAASRRSLILDDLRSRHPRLWQARAQNRSLSASPAMIRALLPLVERLPIPSRRREQAALALVWIAEPDRRTRRHP